MAETVLITGAARGLGSFLAERYLEKGATVFALNKRGEPGGRPLARHFQARLRIFRCDVSKEVEVRTASAEIARLTRSLDLLVNNAAVHLEKPFTEANELDADLVRATFEVNVLGPLLITKHFLPLLLAGNGKTLVNISSEAGSISQCWRDREYGYCMSKAALNMQSAILQNKVRAKGVKVLAIHPGWLRTEMGGRDADLDPAETAGKLVETIARHRALDGPIYVDHTGKPMAW